MGLMKIERTILSNLIHNEEYCRKVVPFIKPEYFGDPTERIIADELLQFFSTYNKPASLDILAIQLGNRSGVGDAQLLALEVYINTLNIHTDNASWLLEHTEKFCKKRAVTNAILDAFDIIEGKDSTRTEDAIPDLLSSALGVCFDTSVGHDLLEDYSSRFDFYHRVEDKLEFDLDIFNKITRGGLSKKTLNIVMAGTGVGKSLFMCHVAAASLMQSKNVLYITMEMSEERIAERIDANLLNMTMVELESAERDVYETRIGRLASKTRGKLIVKEYPTAGAHAGHFKMLLDELKVKKNFEPDLVVVDYLNICASSRVKNTSANSYTIVKSIAEELRGLAQEYNVPILSATQTNREGNASSDIDLTNTSECIFVDETVQLTNGEIKKIGDIQLGDQITSNDNYKTTMFVHHKKMKDCVKITTKSGKTIIVSKDHVFPTNTGRCSVNSGLSVGHKLNTKPN